GRAGGLLAWEHAAALLRRAASMLERCSGPIERLAEIECALGEALQRAGSSTEARRTLARASELSRAADRPDLFARAALASGGSGITIRGADRGLVTRLERALEGIGEGHAELRV